MLVVYLFMIRVPIMNGEKQPLARNELVEFEI